MLTYILLCSIDNKVMVLITFHLGYIDLMISLLPLLLPWGRGLHGHLAVDNETGCMYMCNTSWNLIAANYRSMHMASLSCIATCCLWMFLRWVFSGIKKFLPYVRSSNWMTACVSEDWLPTGKYTQPSFFSSSWNSLITMPLFCTSNNEVAELILLNLLSHNYLLFSWHGHMKCIVKSTKFRKSHLW